eukprot:328151-Ditylum_brightwellii.AAC.1
MKVTKIRSEIKQKETMLNPFLFPEPQLPTLDKSPDEGICELVTTSTDTAWISISAQSKECLQLPVRLAGCGLRELEDHCYAEYLCIMQHGLPPFLD